MTDKPEQSLLNALAVLDAKRMTANELTAAARLKTALLRGRAKGWDTACHALAERACHLLLDHYRDHPGKPQEDLSHAWEAARLIHGAITKARIKARRERQIQLSSQDEG